MSKAEFLKASGSEEFEKDEGWKGVEEDKPYTEEELAEFEKSLEPEDKDQLEQDAEHKVEVNA